MRSRNLLERVRSIAAGLLVLALGLSIQDYRMAAWGQQPQAASGVESQISDKGRATKLGDEVPVFDFARYFVGAWSFEWDIPDGVLGPAGTIRGTITYQPVRSNVYEVLTVANGPLGQFTVSETVTYRPEDKTLMSVVNDSRGMTYRQTASVGGDLGGTYNLYFESVAFTIEKRSVRIKNTLKLTSPMRFRNSVAVSVDGARYSSYGTAWSEKLARNGPDAKN